MPKDKKSKKSGTKSARTPPKRGTPKDKTPATPENSTLGSYGPITKRK